MLRHWPTKGRRRLLGPTSEIRTLFKGQLTRVVHLRCELPWQKACLNALEDLGGLPHNSVLAEEISYTCRQIHPSVWIPCWAESANKGKCKMLLRSSGKACHGRPSKNFSVAFCIFLCLYFPSNPFLQESVRPTHSPQNQCAAHAKTCKNGGPRAQEEMTTSMPTTSLHPGSKGIMGRSQNRFKPLAGAKRLNSEFCVRPLCFNRWLNSI